MRKLWLASLFAVLIAAPASAQIAGPFARVVFGSDSGPIITSGTGSPEGVVTASGGSLYLQTDGASGFTLWTKVGSGNTGWEAPTGGGGGTHNLLSATHPDTSTAAAVRGAVIVGNSTPAWSRVSLGAAGTFFRSDGTDPGWSANGASLTGLNASELASGTVPDARLSANVSLFGSAVDNSEITNSTITFGKWASNSCATNDIPKYNGAAWACATDETGSGGSSHSIFSVTHTDTVAGTGVAGDVPVYNGAALLDRVAVGTDGQVFTVVSGAPAWADPSSASGTVTNTGTLTSGKTIVGNGTTDVTVSSLTANLVTSSSGTLSGATASANSKLLGSGASGSGSAYSELTLGTNLSMSGTTLNASGGSGNIVSTSATASPPGSPASGDVWLPTDSFYLYRYSGSAWVPWGPIFPMADPNLQTWSWVNQSTATVSTTHGGIVLSNLGSGGGNSYNLRVMTAPATPYTITAYFLGNSINSGNQDFGIGFRESGTGKLTILRWHNDLSLVVTTLSAATTPVANVATNASLTVRPPWFRITNNGTNISFYYSYDGINFSNAVYNVAKNTYFTTGPDQVGFFVNESTGLQPLYMTLLSWVVN